MIDADALLVALLADLAPTVRALVLPHEPTLPAIRVQRIGGEVELDPLAVEAIRAQVDIWATEHATAQTTTDAVLDRLDATVGTTSSGVLIAGVRVLSLRSSRDASLVPATVRYLLDLRVFARPALAA